MTMSEQGEPVVERAEDALELQPDRHMTYLLAKVQHQMGLALGRALQPVGLTLTQFYALANIHAHPGISSADLARRLLTSPQAIGTLIQRLQSADLIAYEQRPRGYTGAIQLTFHGEERLRTAAEVATIVEARNLAVLSPGEQEATSGYLSRLLEALNGSAAELA